MRSVLVALWLFGPCGAATAQERNAPPRFEGRMIVSVSDADMLPSAYDDGLLGPAAGTDALSVIRLDRSDGDYRAVETPVSNSVTGPPSSVAVTPDGRYAVVIEMRGARPTSGSTRLSELGTGRMVTLVDLSQPDRPRVVQRVAGFASPDSVSIDPTGTVVAISYRPAPEPDAPLPLAFYRLVGGRLSDAQVPNIPGWRSGGGLIGTAFHPREPVLALLNVSRPAISFVRLSDREGAIELAPWGNAVVPCLPPSTTRSSTG